MEVHSPPQTCPHMAYVCPTSKGTLPRPPSSRNGLQATSNGVTPKCSLLWSQGTFQCSNSLNPSHHFMRDQLEEQALTDHHPHLNLAKTLPAAPSKISTRSVLPASKRGMARSKPLVQRSVLRGGAQSWHRSSSAITLQSGRPVLATFKSTGTVSPPDDISSTYVGSTHSNR